MVRGLVSLIAGALLFAHALPAQSPDADGAALSLDNPDGTLRFTLLRRGDSLSYRVDRLTAVGGDETVIAPSPLGITRASGDYTHGVTLVSATRPTDVVDWYRMTTGKQREIRARGRQRVFTLRSESGGLYTVTARAYADGVAFRYGFPRGEMAQDSLVGEATGFHIPVGGRAWMQPYSRVSMWAPAYEGDYRNGIPVGTAAPENVGWALPMLFSSNANWILVTEAGLDRTSYGVHIDRRATNGVYRVRLPEENETYGVAPQAAVIGFPWSSPWRVIMIGPTLGSIVESTLVTDLAQPAAFTDVSWIRPGRASWSWWSDMGSPRDYRTLTSFIDLSQRMRWEYSLLDLGWQEMSNGGGVSDLATYARTHGVGLVAWYNSGGEHNQVADAGPKDLLASPEARRAELRRIRALGFRGIKVDFMQSDKQYVIALYEDILRDAAANRLFVDFHGSTIPRGWQRTWPNLLSMEAVKGAEQYGDPQFQRNAAMFNTIYPFTRNVIGSMDYTPVIFGNAPNRIRNLTTSAHELALSVVFESGLQHFVSTPDMIDEQPDYVRRFLQAVPTVWDETHFVDGYPGRMAVLARRRGTEWYLGGINGQSSVAVAQIPLNFLATAGYDVALIADDGEDDRSFQLATQRLTNLDTITVEMAPRGGFAARLTLRRPGPSRRARD